ncbi:hypothetical protein CDAR_444221 [Caerostris darwini]|uniref:Ycf15 n=1 Tax=Caerostris darwini TaxID=1538125 RepID=A0AAV4X977_9ARAC|nr:hypothetical protein CDAR_444221 [Caerostris darwini]
MRASINYGSFFLARDKRGDLIIRQYATGCSSPVPQTTLEWDQMDEKRNPTSVNEPNMQKRRTGRPLGKNESFNHPSLERHIFTSASFDFADSDC